MIEYLENKIKSCDELGGMEKEKWAFTQCLKHYRENSNQVQAGVSQATCGDCEYFNLFASSEYYEGSCNYKVKFPDSLFARAEGMKKKMRGTDGRNCPCFKSKLSG